MLSSIPSVFGGPLTQPRTAMARMVPARALGEHRGQMPSSWRHQCLGFEVEQCPGPERRRVACSPCTRVRKVVGSKPGGAWGTPADLREAILLATHFSRHQDAHHPTFPVGHNTSQTRSGTIRVNLGRDSACVDCATPATWLVAAWR